MRPCCFYRVENKIIIKNTNRKLSVRQDAKMSKFASKFMVFCQYSCKIVLQFSSPKILFLQGLMGSKNDKFAKKLRALYKDLAPDTSRVVTEVEDSFVVCEEINDVVPVAATAE